MKHQKAFLLLVVSLWLAHWPVWKPKRRKGASLCEGLLSALMNCLFLTSVSKKWGLVKRSVFSVRHRALRSGSIGAFSLCLAATLSTFLPNTFASDIKLPSAPPGAYLAEYLRACNAHDESLLAKFAAEHLVLNGTSVAEWTRHKMEECEESSGYDVGAVERAGSNHLTVLLETRAAERWFRVEVDVAPEPPHRLATIHYFQRGAPENTERRGMSDKEIVTEFKAYMDKVEAGDRFSGVVLVAKDSKPIFEQAYGMADRSTRRPNSPDSVFLLASMSKMFTAISVAQLVEQGKLRYEDTVGKFLPEYSNKQVRDKVTVGELLTHTSGLGDFLSRRTEEMMSSGVKRATDYLPLFESDTLLFEPGTRWNYSNAGYALAGAMVEKVSGESYFDYVRKHVFLPAGMLSSDPNEARHVTALMAVPYARPEGGKWNDREPARWDSGSSPAGGSYSTAPDLLRFAQALRENKLVSHRSLEELVAPHSSFKTPRGTDYGYGFETWAKKNGRRVVGHGGGTVGVSTEFDIFLEQGYAVIVLSNDDTDTAKLVAAKLRAMILSK